VNSHCNSLSSVVVVVDLNYLVNEVPECVADVGSNWAGALTWASLYQSCGAAIEYMGADCCYLLMEIECVD
jgi:hypothetical protein